jgi:hypothetical protein
MKEKAVRKIQLVLLFSFLTVPCFAQIPSANVFFGYSYLNADTNGSGRLNVHGWDASAEGKILPFIGIVGDVSRHYSDQVVCVIAPPVSCPPSLNGKLDSYLFGPRVSVSIGGVRPFAHALFGVAHTDTSGSFLSDTAFATAIGGGADFRLIPLLAWRAQVDFLQTKLLSNTQNNVRVSTGLVLRF